MGKLLIIVGVVLVIAGVIISFADRIPFLGKLPGDIRIERENIKIYFPIATSIVVSILLTLVLYIINRMKS